MSKNWSVVILCVVATAITLWLTGFRSNSPNKVLLDSKERSVLFGPYIYDATNPQPVSEQVEIQNNTSELLEVDRVQKSCGCINNFSFDERPLAPGESIKLSFDVMPAGTVGAKLVKVLFQSSQGAVFPCKFKLVSFPDIHFAEGSHWKLTNGKDIRAKNIVESFKVRTYATENAKLLEIASVNSFGNKVKIETRKSLSNTSLNPGVFVNEWIVDVTLDATANGFGRDRLDFVFKDRLGNERARTVSLSTEVNCEFFAKPSGVFFMIDSKKKDFTYKVQVCSRDNSPFNIKRVSSSSSKLKLDVVAIQEGVFEVVIAGNPFDFSDGLLETLDIEIAESLEVISVNIAGVVEGRRSRND